jgi:sarcosine oxidase
MSERYGAVVVGGGVVGLAAAWHLLRLGCRPVAVLERFRIGHPHGSSHGSVRMTRSTYSSATYASLMRHVHAEEWPRLERDAGVTLIHRGDVVFFGPDHAALRAYADAVRAAGADVDRLAPADARRMFPALRFAAGAEILHDRTGGAIASADTMSALRRLVEAQGGRVIEDARVTEIDRGADPIRVVSERGVLEADRVVIATGAWLRDLVPSVRSLTTVVVQTIGYFRLGVPARSLPGWIHFGGAEGIAYGLAERDRDVMKAAIHATQGSDADPDTVPPAAIGEAEALRPLIERIVAVPVIDVAGVERCLYTSTPTEDFVIDRWPGDPRVAFASACSGHGFKFAPMTGRLLAELVVDGEAKLPDGHEARALFGLGAAR